MSMLRLSVFFLFVMVEHLSQHKLCLSHPYQWHVFRREERLPQDMFSLVHSHIGFFKDAQKRRMAVINDTSIIAFSVFVDYTTFLPSSTTEIQEILSRYE